MKLDWIDNQISQLAVRFFYKFSRFEYSMKQVEWCKEIGRHSDIAPDWEGMFFNSLKTNYVAPETARSLRAEDPKRFRRRADGFEWVSCNNEQHALLKTIFDLKTVRNNLFHGGKHENSGWDNPKRTKKLLSLSIEVIDDLAVQTGTICGDFSIHYSSDY
ncbi:hypothetical protein [Leisingera daeponensis]|uniref:hypothetical protein n=1 Tax=Leisingera daeponensis TaxID=405746 RepID=UPI0012B64A9F|nr:hypothetical protein [Leisingera daeponensis]